MFYHALASLHVDSVSQLAVLTNLRFLFCPEQKHSTISARISGLWQIRTHLSIYPQQPALLGPNSWAAVQPSWT